MKKRNCIVYVSNLRIRDYDWKNREIGYLNKYHNFKIILQDVANFVNPHKTVIKSNKIKKKTQFFSNINRWERKILQIKKDKKLKIKIMMKMHPYNFKIFNMYRFLKKEKIDTIFFPYAGHPQIKKKIDFEFLIFKLKFVLRNPLSLYRILESNLFIILVKILKLYPNYIIEHGKKNILPYNKKIKVIKGNNHDYSNYLSIKKNIRAKRKYALFLEQPTPMFSGDNVNQGFAKNEMFTSKVWFPSLNKFFDQLEDLTKTKIKIVSHPKVKHSKNPVYYGKREVFNQGLVKQSFYAKFLISQLSTGMGLCAVQKIPALIIYSDELKKNLSQTVKIFHTAAELGTNPINIDQEFNINEIKKALKINKKKLNLYKYNYLTSRKDNKPNHEIISELFNHE